MAHSQRWGHGDVQKSRCNYSPRLYLFSIDTLKNSVGVIVKTRPNFEYLESGQKTAISHCIRRPGGVDVDKPSIRSAQETPTMYLENKANTYQINTLYLNVIVALLPKSSGSLS
jgi:hypothetical protein